MYRLFSRLFGWEYVGVIYGSGITLCRVKRAKDTRRPYIEPCGSFYWLDEWRDRPLPMTGNAVELVDKCEHIKANRQPS